MTITLHLSPEDERKLMERAETGQDVAIHVQRQIARDEMERTRPLAEVLAPIHEDFRQSGMTEEELDTLLESELAAARNERK